MNKRLFIILLFAVMMIPVCSTWSSESAAEQFVMANKFYEEKDFASAVRLYEAALKQGVESATLYYNLGNAYFKTGDIGHAILNYLRAKRLAPSDEDINHNLEFVRQFSRVQMEGVALNPINSFLNRIVAPYRLTTLAWITSAIFILFCVMLMLRLGIGYSGTFIRTSTVVLLVLLLIAGGLTTFKYRTDYITERAVIVKETEVLNGPTDKADIEFQGTPGLIVEIISESGDYYDVLFENKRRGWILKDDVEKV